jgi:signal transduction histidine kinase
MAVAGNATRFAAAEVRLLVEVEQTLRIHVDDDGPGVPPDQWDAIFEPLAQVDPQAPHSGIGMGLAIATRIVEAHGGVLFVSESPLGGARFTIELPVA